MTVSLNFDNPRYTNTLITMRRENDDSFNHSVNSYERMKKVLYKKEKT